MYQFLVFNEAAVLIEFVFDSMLRIHGQFVTVGLPDNPLPPIQPFTFAANGALFGASHIGSKREAMEMLDLAAKKGIKPW